MKERIISPLAGRGYRQNQSGGKDMVVPEVPKSQVDICEDEEEVMDLQILV